MPFGYAAAAAAVGTIGSAYISGEASKKAAKTQANAANAASQVQQNMFDTTQQNLSPYMDAGTNALQQLLAGLGLNQTTSTAGAPVSDADILKTIQQSYASSSPNDIAAGVSPGNPIGGTRYEFNDFYDPTTGKITDRDKALQYYTALTGQGGQTTTTTPGTGVGALNKPFTTADFHNSPGYQFQLQQGENAVLNNASRTGGVNSGNTLKALTSFGQGVANQDYWNAYNAYVARQNQQFNQFNTVAGSGQNAAVNQGTFGANAAGQIGSDLIGAGNANAAGAVGNANALASGLGQLGGIGSNFLLNYGNQNNGNNSSNIWYTGPSVDQ